MPGFFSVPSFTDVTHFFFARFNFCPTKTTSLMLRLCVFLSFTGIFFVSCSFSCCFDLRLLVKVCHKFSVSSTAVHEQGRFPFSQNFRDFRSEIQWNGKVPERISENLGLPFELTLVSGISRITEFFVFHSSDECRI